MRSVAKPLCSSHVGDTYDGRVKHPNSLLITVPHEHLTFGACSPPEMLSTVIVLEQTGHVTVIDCSDGIDASGVCFTILMSPISI